MHESLLGQGLDLMIYGMGTVLVFLALLVVVMTTMSKVMLKYFPDPPEPSSIKPSSTPSAAQAAETVQPAVLAAIQQAILQHREKR